MVTATVSDAGPASRAALARASYLDNLKTALTALVIAHHAAITFGADGSWYYRDPSEPYSLPLTVFVGVNQSFFMGLFFFAAGYFTPASFERKGFWRFLSDRALRLGLPTLFFGWVIAPALEYAKRTSLGRTTPPFGVYFVDRDRRITYWN